MLFIKSITDTIVTLISQSISVSVFDLLESMAGCSHVETINVIYRLSETKEHKRLSMVI